MVQSASFIKKDWEEFQALLKEFQHRNPFYFQEDYSHVKLEKKINYIVES